MTERKKKSSTVPKDGKEERSPEALAVGWIIDGATRFDVLDRLKKQFPRINPEKALQQSVEYLLGVPDEPLKFVLGKTILQFDDLRQKLIAAKDYTGAVSALRNSFQVRKFAREIFGPQDDPPPNTGKGDDYAWIDDL